MLDFFGLFGFLKGFVMVLRRHHGVRNVENAVDSFVDWDEACHMCQLINRLHQIAMAVPGCTSGQIELALAFPNLKFRSAQLSGR